MKISKLRFVIIGYGSIGRKHAKILKKLGVKKIFILSKQKKIFYTRLATLKDIIDINPDYVIIACPTIRHYFYLSYLEKNLKKKIILVEKPLFEKHKILKIKNNKVLVGYNLRFHPILKHIKQIIKNKKIWFVSSSCTSYLPDWRKNRNYVYTSSANKASGGGVLLDLSHELDYLQWIFGSITPKYVKNLKLSNLKIDTDDYFFLYATNKKKTHFNLMYTCEN